MCTTKAHHFNCCQQSESNAVTVKLRYCRAALPIICPSCLQCFWRFVLGGGSGGWTEGWGVPHLVIKTAMNVLRYILNVLMA